MSEWIVHGLSILMMIALVIYLRKHPSSLYSTTKLFAYILGGSFIGLILAIAVMLNDYCDISSCPWWELLIVQIFPNGSYIFFFPIIIALLMAALFRIQSDHK